MSTINLGQIVPNITVGETTTLQPNQSATVSNTGTGLNPVFNFGIPKGEKGDTGSTGSTGASGKDGKDGVSPIITTSKSDKTTTLTITDAEGTKTATILDGNDGSDGRDGSNGADGYSPSASVSKSNGVATITITDKEGTTTASVSDGINGTDGQDGTDGFSPVATVTKSGNTATISITDINGTTTSTVSDGTNGTNGTNGSDGVGLQFNWSGTYLGVKREDDDDYTYQNLQGATGQTGATGQDGYSPIANVRQSGNATTITITDKTGTTSATVYNNNVYSTTKIPIGVWINGKTLYRKVINNISITSTPFYVDTNENIDELINFYAIGWNNTNTEAFKVGHPTFSTQSSSNYGRTIVYEKTNNRFALKQGGAVAYPSKAIVIFEFTETTV